MYYPGDDIIDKAGNIYIVGGGEGGPVITLKYAPNGDTIWTRKHLQSGSNSDGGISLALDSLNNIIIGGSSIISNQYNSLIIKYTQDGSFLWSKTYYAGQSEFFKVGVDGNNFIYATGTTYNFNDYLTIKYNSSGVQQWVKWYRSPTGNSSNGANSLAIDKNNNIYVTGIGEGYLSIEDIVTIKYNSNGDSLWVRSYDNPVHGDDEAYNIVIDSESNIYVNGKSFLTIGWFLTTIKYSSSGNQEWLVQYPGDYPGIGQEVRAISIDKSNNIYVTGGNSDNGTNADYVTIKYSQPIGIKKISREIANNFILSQNFPNPFNPKTIFRFDIPKESFTKLIVYDVIGREVGMLVNEKLQPGKYEIEWEAGNYASGVYFYKLFARQDGSTTGDYTDTKKMVLMK